MAKSMLHWWGNQLCAIDVETTGLDDYWNEIIQIAILPLDSNIDVRKDVKPFNIYIKPDDFEMIDPQALKVNKITMDTLINHGFDRETAIGLLEDWISKLGLPTSQGGKPKKIVPLGQNYAFDRGFIQRWLGVDQYNDWFDYHYKDTMITANYLNDRAAFQVEDVPFKKVNLRYLASSLGIPHENAHDAFSDCLTCAMVYKKMLQMGPLLG